MSKTVRFIVNNKTQMFEVTETQILGRGGKVVMELGDHERKATKENYLLTDQKHMYRFYGFVVVGPRHEPNGIVAKCRRLDGDKEHVGLFPEGHPHAGDEWFYWVPVTEFTSWSGT